MCQTCTQKMANSADNSEEGTSESYGFSVDLTYDITTTNSKGVKQVKKNQD